MQGYLSFTHCDSTELIDICISGLLVVVALYFKHTVPLTSWCVDWNNSCWFICPWSTFHLIHLHIRNMEVQFGYYLAMLDKCAGITSLWKHNAQAFVGRMYWIYTNLASYALCYLELSIFLSSASKVFSPTALDALEDKPKDTSTTLTGKQRRGKLVVSDT